MTLELLAAAVLSEVGAAPADEYVLLELVLMLLELALVEAPTEALMLSAARASMVSAASSNSALTYASDSLCRACMMWFCKPAVLACGGAQASRAFTSERKVSAG